LATEVAAENPIQTPRQVISGAILLSSGTFETNGMSSLTCAQAAQYPVPHQVYGVIVDGVAFGGTIGTQNALVIDDYQTAVPPAVNHVERYFYVNGYGRVREGSSYYDSATGLYDTPYAPNSNRNTLEPNTIPIPAVQCPQGGTLGL
jgi:hypothetical protein